MVVSKSMPSAIFDRTSAYKRRDETQRKTDTGAGISGVLHPLPGSCSAPIQHGLSSTRFITAVSTVATTMVSHSTDDGEQQL